MKNVQVISRAVEQLDKKGVNFERWIALTQKE